MYDRVSAPTDAQISKFEYLSPMLDSALTEMREFAKKKQDGIVSKLKIMILNRLLTNLRTLLEHEDSLQYLDLLSEEDLPQNSDAVIVLGQYRAALNGFKSKHHKYVEHVHRWITKEWIDSRQSAVQSQEEGGDGDEDDEDYEDGGVEEGEEEVEEE